VKKFLVASQTPT